MGEPHFKALEWFRVKGRGWLAMVECDRERPRDGSDLKGSIVQIDGERFVVVGIDRDMPAYPIRKGEKIGLLVDSWQDISTAPKGGGAEFVTDPKWVEPPRILLRFGDEAVSVAYWDWYYAEGGAGYRDGFAWIEPCSGEPLNLHYSEPPTHWQPLPPRLGRPSGSAPTGLLQLRECDT